MDSKKKTLTISKNFVKKPNFKKNFKKSGSVSQRSFPKPKLQPNNFQRKFVEKTAKKDFIKKKEDKVAKKSKLTLKSPIKRDFKMTVSRALNVEEVEIKQRSLASVKRARLKEKRVSEKDDKKEFKKVIREVKIPNKITIQELSNRMAEKSSDIIKFLLNMKVMATINHTIDKDTSEYIVKEFGHKPIIEELPTSEIKKDKKIDGEIKHRPPVVTIMGHVDHGKTSLLDALRNSNVVKGEHGGITQHIGAYQVGDKEQNLITFIDTPGHAAFTEMRARGSKITDIVVLVVAADDGVKPQTVEAITHAKAAKVPIIVAINKCDLPNKNISKIKNELMKYELVAEDLSGDVLFVEVSSLKKTNLDKLKENILLQAEILDLKASFSNKASGVVIESKIDKGKGPVSTILISNGVLKRGDHFVCGGTWGKIRAMIDYKGGIINEATPSTPVEILGMNESVFAGEELLVTDTETEAKEIAGYKKENAVYNNKVINTDEKTALFEKADKKNVLNLIIKSDVQGSSEALKTAILKIKHDEVKINLISSNIGMINETDISLAKASNAIIVGFNVKPNREAKILSEQQKIEVKFFNVIYEVLDFISKALSGLLEPEYKEKIIGSAEIQKIFKISDIGKIAGSKVFEGEIKSKSKARIIRDGTVVYDGEIISIFREKNAVKEVQNGQECGIGLKGFIDFKEKDIIEAYLSEKIERNI